jgi:hypothetical protein
MDDRPSGGRKAPVDRTRRTGRLVRRPPPELGKGCSAALSGHAGCTAGLSRLSSAPRPLSSASGNRCPWVSIVSAMVACPSRVWIAFGCRPALISVDAWKCPMSWNLVAGRSPHDSTATCQHSRTTTAHWSAGRTTWRLPGQRVVIAVRRDAEVQADRLAFFTSDQVAVPATRRSASSSRTPPPWCGCDSG